MVGATKPQRCGLALSMLALMLSCGCSHIRLPAIDPSGRNIFLPPPNYTTLVGPTAPTGPRNCFSGWSCLPKPAFQDVPTPPPCGSTPDPCATGPATGPAKRRQGSWCGLDDNFGCRKNIPGRLQLTPTQLIAPIGTEVVLLSGLCGDHGYFVTRQPIEWILSQDSVGNIVDAGESEPSLFHFVAKERTGKLSSNFAITQTSHCEKLVTRGTPAPTDDVVVAKGQSWVTLTSPTEGSSYVTVMAPNAENWDKRRQTARIHWVDAQWQFPAPSLVPAGERQVLSTTVTRSNGTALPFPWIVRYEIAGGAPAVLGANREQAVEAATDANGRAVVEVFPQSPDPGVTQIRMQVVRPAAGESPRLVVGEGYTTVGWSAPGLAIQLTGPASAIVGGTLVYRAEVSNPGDLVSRDVTVTSTIPPRIAFLSSNVQPEIFGNRLNWRIGDLAPKSTRVLEITCRAEREGDIRYCVNGQSAEGRKAENCVATSIIAPAISIRMAPDQEMLEAGNQVTFEIEIANTGSRPLAGARLIDRFDDGLEHVSGERSPISRELPELAPGETQTVRLTFVVRRAGQLCNVLEVTAPGGQGGSARACVTATPSTAPAAPRAELQIDAPGERRVGEVAQVILTATNRGGAPLSNFRISAAFGPLLEPQQASPDHRRSPGELFWIVADLQPGQSITRQINFLCQNAGEAAIRATLTSSQGASAEQLAAITITGDGATTARSVPKEPELNSAQPAPKGTLTVTVRDTDEGIKVGQTTRYIVVVANERKESDTRVALSVFLPEGLEFLSLSGGMPLPPKRTAEGVTISVTTINEVRAGETLPRYEFEVRAKRAGVFRVRAEVTSRLSPDPVVAEQETTVQAK